MDRTWSEQKSKFFRADLNFAMSFSFSGQRILLSGACGFNTDELREELASKSQKAPRKKSDR